MIERNLESLSPSRRTDLVIVRRESIAPTWVVKDPVQLTYHNLDELQYWVFEKLNGVNSIAMIVEKFNACFAPLHATAEEIYAFCIKLSNDNLLNEVATGEKIATRAAASNRGRLLKIPMSLLSIKLPSVNARGLFDISEMLFSWIFSPVAVLATMILLAFALLTVADNFNTFIAELPFLDSFTGQDVVSFLLALSIVKICHELGHAVCCRRMGAECNEMGLMFLVFSPCLYCTVTDSWILPERWKRIAVAAAGVYVELIIAAAMLLCWNYCEQPLIRSFFLNIVLICSISTLLVNGNPLMRYDGYFVLSDLSAIPNLATEARMTAWNLIANFLFHGTEKENRFYTVRQQLFMVSYYVLSVAYRVFIMAAIFWLAYGRLKSVGLSNFAIGVLSVYGILMVAMFVVGFASFLIKKGKKEPLRWLGVFLFLVALVCIGYFVGKVEVEQSINARAVVEFEDYEFCSSSSQGTLSFAVKPGTVVKKGDLIIGLENDVFEKRIRELKHELKLIKVQIKNLETLEGSDSKSQFELPELKAQLTDLETQIAGNKANAERLNVRSLRSGTVVELHEAAPKENGLESLPGRVGSILKPENRGCLVETGEVICLVCDPEKYIVYLMVDEQKLDLVQEGDEVELFFPSLKPQQFTGKFVGFSRDSLNSRFGENAEPLESNSVRAIVELKDPIKYAFHRSLGKANIAIQKDTIGGIVQRFLVESFRFKL